MCDIEPEEFAELLRYREAAPAKGSVRRRPRLPESVTWAGPTDPTAVAEA